MNEVLAVIDQHIPSLTENDESAIWKLFDGTVSLSEVDFADLSIRTCSCGKRIDGFYEYADHLKAVLGD